MKILWQKLGIALFWVSWPALYVYLRKSSRSRVYILAGENILLVKGWLSNGGWMLPGGGIHRREDPLQGAIREVREETGLLLRPEQLLFVGAEQQARYGFKFKTYVYVYAAGLEEPVALQHRRGEIIAAEWRSLDSLIHEPFITKVREVQRLLAGRP